MRAWSPKSAAQAKEKGEAFRLHPFFASAVACAPAYAKPLPAAIPAPAVVAAVGIAAIVVGAIAIAAVIAAIIRRAEPEMGAKRPNADSDAEERRLHFHGGILRHRRINAEARRG